MIAATREKGFKQERGTLLREYFILDLDRDVSFELVLNFPLLSASE